MGCAITTMARRARRPTLLHAMPLAPAAVPRSTTISSLRARHEDVARQVRRCEAHVERLRAELAMPPVHPGAAPPAERAMISAVRDLVEARARLAQVSRELRRAELS